LIDTWNTYKRLAMPDTPPEVRFKPFIIGLAARVRPYDAHHKIFRWDKRARLGLITCPALLLSGKGDPFVKRQEELCNMIPDCELATLEGGGAMVCHEKPEAFAQIVLDFLKAG
jgi:pimeloyl-ACP methyl ester carboxylesterase